MCERESRVGREKEAEREGVEGRKRERDAENPGGGGGGVQRKCQQGTFKVKKSKIDNIRTVLSRVSFFEMLVSVWIYLSFSVTFQALWSRFMPAYRYLAEKVAEGDDGPLGRPKLVLCNMGYRERPWVNNPRQKENAMGGGALMDIGVYGLNIASLAFGGERPQKVANHLFDTSLVI